MNNGKMVVLKPVVWNDQGYRWPAGKVATSGYTKMHGYGHEEWNGRDDWVWNDWKIFHTEAKGAMLDYAAEGRLGIIMTTMKDKKHYAVGVGTHVFSNNEEDTIAIYKSLKIHDYAKEMWKVASIKKAMKTEAALTTHWHSHTHVAWRCPRSHYAWFGTPIEIIPNDLIPTIPARQAIVKMHGSYQSIRPDQALSIVRQVLPDNHSVIGWLSTGDFDDVRNKSVRDAPSPKIGGKRSASTASDPYKLYLQENEVLVSPLHGILQNSFVSHLRKRRIESIKENIQFVDLRYEDPKNGLVYVEVKPTRPDTVRFAIRAAIGQLSDYRQHAKKPPGVLIVIDDEPSEFDKALALSNGFGIAWRNGATFAYAWPE